MKKYKNYVYYLNRSYNTITVLNLNLKIVTVVFLPSRIYLNKKLPLNILIRWEKNYILHYSKNRRLRITPIVHVVNENQKAEIKYKKLIKEIKNYSRDWWKGNLEERIRQIEAKEGITLWGV
jgi:hypothetical protein